MKARKIKVGTYKYEKTPENWITKTSNFGGTNYWDELIEKAGLVGKKFSVILEENIDENS